MATVKWSSRKNEIYNDRGFQLLGKSAANPDAINPRELLEASVALCVSITLEQLFERDQIEVDASSVQIDVSAAKTGDITNRFTDLKVEVQLPDTLDPAYKKKLAVLIERGCTISNTLKAGAQIDIEIS